MYGEGEVHIKYLEEWEIQTKRFRWKKRQGIEPLYPKLY